MSMPPGTRGKMLVALGFNLTRGMIKNLTFLEKDRYILT